MNSDGVANAESVFTVGIVEGDRAGNRALRTAVARLLKARHDLSLIGDDSENALRVNVIYNVPGDIWPVRFSGVERGAFSRKRRLQAIQVAVPEGLSDEQVLGFVDETLRAAMDIASDVAQKRGLSVELAQSLATGAVAALRGERPSS